MESDNNIYYVYCISNNIDDKMYIGYTKRFDDRMREHCKSKYYIGNAIRKHGKKNFTFQKLLWFYSEAEAKDAEKLMISELNTLAPIGYNEAEGGCGNPLAGADEEKRKEWKQRKSEGYLNMTSDENVLWRKRQSEGHKKRSPEVESLRRERISEGHKKRSHEAKALAKQRQKETNDKKSPQEEILRRKRISEAYDKKSPEAKALWRKNISEGHTSMNSEKDALWRERLSKAASGSKNHRYVYLSPEQEDFIREQKKSGLPACKIPQPFFKRFDIKIGSTVIRRILNSL
jgi:group I intron endonuclease